MRQTKAPFKKWSYLPQQLKEYRDSDRDSDGLIQNLQQPHIRSSEMAGIRLP